MLTGTYQSDQRTLELSGLPSDPTGTIVLHLEGVRDRSGNQMLAFERTLEISGGGAEQVLFDISPPQLLAVLDGADGIYLVFDEPVEMAPGVDASTALEVDWAGADGELTEVTETLWRWEPRVQDVGSVYQLGSSYTIQACHLVDTGPDPDEPSGSLWPIRVTHLAASDDIAFIAYRAPLDTPRRATSEYGLTTAFQGRTWHHDLGLYHYRARWYDPTLQSFVQPDPLGYVDSHNLFQGLGYSGYNTLDPFGLASDCGSQYFGYHSVPAEQGSNARSRGEAQFQRFLGGVASVPVLAGQAVIGVTVSLLDLASHAYPILPPILGAEERNTERWHALRHPLETFIEQHGERIERVQVLEDEGQYFSSGLEAGSMGAEYSFIAITTVEGGVAVFGSLDQLLRALAVILALPYG